MGTAGWAERVAESVYVKMPPRGLFRSCPHSPFTIHHSPFTIRRFIPLPITLPYHAPVPPAGTPIMTVVVRGGTGPRHGANVARCRGRRTDRQGAGFHVRRGCGN